MVIAENTEEMDARVNNTKKACISANLLICPSDLIEKKFGALFYFPAKTKGILKHFIPEFIPEIKKSFF